MRFRKREPLLSVLLGTGLHLLDSLRDRVERGDYRLS
jgi:hypothetical protein